MTGRPTLQGAGARGTRLEGIRSPGTGRGQGTASPRIIRRDGRPAAGQGRDGTVADVAVAELCERFAGVCASAVDPLEIASALEFDGMGDQAAQERYGADDVFALAEELYRRVPRRPAEPEPAPDPWRVSKFRPALHALLYGLPAVCFPVAGGLLGGPGVLRALIASLLISWAVSQSLAYLGYLRLGKAGMEGARQVLRAGLVAGTLVIGLALAATALVVHARPTVFVFGAGQGLYMLGACAVLVLGAERLLLAVLAPAVLGSTVFLLLGRPPSLELATWMALAVTPVLALALAAALTSWRGVSKGKLWVAAELRGALPSAGFGMVAAGLLAFPVAAGLHGHGGANPGALIATLPLSLSMGAAEWSLSWYRRRTQRLLRATWEPQVFAARARLALLVALLQYLAAATALTVPAAVIAVSGRLVPPRAPVVPELLAYLALGGAMFMALLTQAFGGRVFPLIACAAALALEVGSRDLGAAAQVVVCSALLVVLGTYAAVVLGRVVRHAY